eukprot:Amastigsp_a1926_20.p4 type:complete len:114 gc:universal Amastigsp_a1926_20:1190-1531(+)
MAVREMLRVRLGNVGHADDALPQNHVQNVLGVRILYVARRVADGCRKRVQDQRVTRHKAHVVRTRAVEVRCLGFPLARRKPPHKAPLEQNLKRKTHVVHIRLALQMLYDAAQR